MNLKLGLVKILSLNLFKMLTFGSVVPLAMFLCNPCRLAQAAHCTMPLVSVQGLVQMWPDQQALDGAGPALPYPHTPFTSSSHPTPLNAPADT